MGYVDTLDNFDIDSLPDLDTVVMGALELFSNVDVPKLDLRAYKHPLIVGSGNAEATGRILFHDADAIFASESSYEGELESIDAIDGVVLISASGGKHAPIIAKCSRDHGRHVSLITNTPDSPADHELDHEHPYDEFVFPKNREPYTYNTSTYLGMILGKTGESAADIMKFIDENVATIDWPDFASFDKYYIIIPSQFSEFKRMIEVKFIELFGRNIARDVETAEYVRHATTVAPANELFISFGEENTTWGKPENRLNVPLPEKADYGAMLAIGYYTVAQIQKAHPQYFKDNIAEYTVMVSEIFGSEIKPIVDN